MAELLKRKKPLSVSPLKASQTMGAALAFLGLDRCMPLMHGSQGCTAFAKVFFVRHFREPVPLQTTAMEQISSVMGADENVVEALRAIASNSNPAVIGLVTTGLAETQGCDVQGAVKLFRQKYPEFQQTQIVAVNTPDYGGCFESGYAQALKAIVENLVPPAGYKEPYAPNPRTSQVNVLCHANLTPGDLEYIADSIESFGLKPLLLPNLANSLDGHLPEEDFNPLTTGGLAIEDLQTVAESKATLVIGDSIGAAADSLLKLTGVPEYRFSHLMTIEAIDHWLMTLSGISQQPVAPKWQRHRQQLQDAMLDTHFMLGTMRFGMAADADLLLGFEAMMASMGAAMVGAVVPAKTRTVAKLNISSVQVGDMEDFEILAKAGDAQLLIGNSHAVASAQRLKLPILRAGFPQYDYLGGFQRVWCGYQGVRNTLFEIANLLTAHHAEIPVYRSVYSQKKDLAESAAAR